MTDRSDGGRPPSDPNSTTESNPSKNSRLDRWRLFVDRRTPDVGRRTFLKAGGVTAGVGTVSAAVRGWYPLGVGIPGNVRPPGDPPGIPSPLGEDCEAESTTRLTQTAEEVHRGTFPDNSGRPAFELRVEETTYRRGETVEVTLTNVSPRPYELGQSSVRHNVQVLTEAGWQDVRVIDGDSSEIPQTGTSAGFPGRVEEWSFPLTDAGVTDLHGASSSMQVCPGLPVGRYRFLCSAMGDWDDGVAVAFDVVA